MVGSFLQGLGHFDALVVVMMLVGVLAGTVVAIIPGMGGLFVLAIALPFTYGMQPDAALALLLASAVVVGTGNTVTGVLFGVPGNVSGVTTTFDGFPMAKRGEADRAMAAGFTASAVGGIVGAVVLALLLPVVRPLIFLFGPAEFLVLVFLALLLMAQVGSGDALKGLVSGGIGLMLAFVGQEGSTATLRYTFGSIYLYDGIRLIPLVIGLFAIAEMLQLIKSKTSISDPAAEPGTRGGTLQGMRDVVRHWRVTLQASVIGVVVGLLPGLGGETAQFAAYGQAAKTSKRGHLFGTGEVEGVIASDAATNAKDGGSLIPTLAFGVPGSAPMAILLAAFIIFGIRPGANMLTENVHLTWFFILVLVLSNLAAAALCLLLARPLAKLTKLRVSLLVPPILVISLFGAYETTHHVGDIVTALAFGLIGYLMVEHGYSRSTFIVAVVLGELLEYNFNLAHQIHGWTFLTRPMVLVLIVLGAAMSVAPTLYRRWSSRRGSSARQPSNVP